jgi:isocitrate/isopropylmalate dehydrogenase
MLLDQLGQPEAARLVMAALAQVVRAGTTLTNDLGGSGGTREVTDALVAAVGATA